MDYQREFYPESRFGGFTDIDGTIAFYTRVNALLSPGAVVLDVGCGRGEYEQDRVAVRRQLRIFKGRCARVIGIDVDDAGQKNPFLDEFRLLTQDRWPLADASVDLCLADCVMEHVTDPDAFLVEAERALRPGGYLCMRTANGFGYVALAARIVPNRSHARVLNRVQEARKAEDVFPTVYRCNTRGKLLRAMRRHGLDGVVYGYEAEPKYLQFSKLAYRLGVIYQRFAPRAFANALFVFARKPAVEPGSDA